MVLRGIMPMDASENDELTERQKTSEWTLDYPPFFAGLEWLLAKAAVYADPSMLKLDNLNYSSWQTIYFQRASVVLLELLLVYALNRYGKYRRRETKC